MTTKYQIINNKSRPSHYHFLLIFSLLSIIFYLLSGSAFAQKASQVGITVSPITDEFRLKPGEVISRTIRVINPNDRVITLYPVALDFNTDNENGQPVFFQADDESRSYTLSSWMSFDREFIRVAEAEEELVKITIAAPADAEPGGHYGAVLFSTEKPKLPETDDAEVSVVGLVGTLYLATVPGKISEKLELEQFSLPLISFAPPVNTAVIFKNNGNIHLKPRGEIIIKNWSGNQASVIAVNEGNGNVLPESRRRFEGSWVYKSLTSFGLYSFNLHATYGSGPAEIIATKKVLVIPIWLLILIVAIIGYLLHRLWHRRQNRYLSKEASSNQITKRILQ
ncbi:MAG: hypothetical protein WD157_00945 [Patescibacteria group bacterium]